MSSSTIAWNESVQQSALIENLSLINTTIFVCALILLIVWLAVGLFSAWADGDIKSRDGIFYSARALVLLTFCMYYFI